MLTVVPQGDDETLRQQLYRILPFDTMLRFYIKTATRQVFIDGYVEDLGGDADEPNGDEFAVQVSIICPSPWFQSVEFHEETFLDQQMVAVNAGDVSCGFTFYMDEPTNGYVIRYMHSFEFWVNDAIFRTKPQASDGSTWQFTVPMIFCTIPREKMFYLYDMWFGSRYTDMAVHLIDPTAEWLMLQPGENIVSVSCVTNGSGGVLDWDQWMRLTWRDTYSGV